MVRPGWRKATPQEAAEDWAKRLIALDEAEERGLYSPAQVARYRAELREFTGYDRRVNEDDARRELVARELHHFETEQAITEALALIDQGDVTLARAVLAAALD